MGTVRTFGVRELRNDTSGVLAAAERDGEALIAQRGEVVARVLPVHADGRTPLGDFLRWAERWERTDSGWSDEFRLEKEREAEEVEPKPWE